MIQEKALAQSPVPSITLQITRKDADRFLDASNTLIVKLEDGQFTSIAKPLDDDNDKATSNTERKPLHEMLYDIALGCKHPFVAEFLDRSSTLLQSTGTDPTTHRRNIQAALLLFHDCDKTTKLRHIFTLFASEQQQVSTRSMSCADEEKKDDNIRDVKPGSNEFSLSFENARTMFRTVLSAISCCVHTPEKDSKKMEKPVVELPSAVAGRSNDVEVRPFKRQKIEATNDETEAGEPFSNACQSPSWDSSLATLRDEDDKLSPIPEDDKTSDLRREIVEISRFAVEELFAFASKKRTLQNENDTTGIIDNTAVDFATLGDWYNDSGSNIVPWLELLQLSKWKPASKQKGYLTLTNLIQKPVEARSPEKVEEPKSTSLVIKSSPQVETDYLNSPDCSGLLDSSRTLVSFDFNGSGSPSPLLINISEDNLFALKDLVNQTNLVRCSASEICKAMLQAGIKRVVEGDECFVLRKPDFKRVLKQIIPSSVNNKLSASEKDSFDESFSDFFFCFEECKSWLHSDEVDLKEFTVGFCFFCAGNKSSKLLTGFDLLDNERRGCLTEDQLSRYLQSYLTMLVAMSFLVPISKRNNRKPLTAHRRAELRTAVESGAKWTLGHFLRSVTKRENEYTFECFASWYSAGGYNVAPWLELLDLKKVMSLIGDPHCHLHLPPLSSLELEPSKSNHIGSILRDRVSSLRRHHSSRRGPPPEVLFTFPLGNRRSLVVLKDDASYVRGVVEQLGLLTMNPDTLWAALCKTVAKRRKPAPGDVAVYVDMATFVQCMKEVCPKSNRKRPLLGNATGSSSSSVEEILANFYQCFDIEQCDSVALDELMGGLTLLCGGKKSTKLAFAFSIFDTRPVISASGKKDRLGHSLSGEDLFLFLRSILIVTFSTCRQSLDMSDEIVGRCIADTANMICNDVMRHQWETKQMDRLDFDEFGQWYNDGGFERAPWLELLDLNKWVLLDIDVHARNDITKTTDCDRLSSRTRNSSRNRNREPLKHSSPIPSPESVGPSPPPPPPQLDEALDNSFLDEIDSMDEMDMMLMQSASTDRDELKITKSFSYTNSPGHLHVSSSDSKHVNPLKFHLVTTDDHGGYMLSLSTSRIAHFRRTLESSGLYNLDVETACNQILSKGSRSKLSRKCFDSSLRTMLSSKMPGKHASKSLDGVFTSLFEAFDRDGTGEVSTIEVACGFTVLCQGKKSDKLEFAFEVLDKKKRGRLSQTDMSNYLRSFLTVLLTVAFTSSLDNDPKDDVVLTMSGSPCERSTAMLIRVVKAAADWAASLAFREFEIGHKDERVAMSFDDFASWYTRVGYSSIPWLELLDLQKWAMVQDSKT